MTTYKITSLNGVSLNGNTKLTSNQLKTSSGNAITFQNKAGTVALSSDIPTVPDTSKMVTTDGTQTLTNKTLTTPTISSIKNGSYTLTVPSKTATLATTSDGYLTAHQSLDSCVKTSGNQTVAGVKTFSSAPKLSTNTITNSSGKTITLPSSAGTLALTSQITSSTYSDANVKTWVLNNLYPVGSIYLGSTSPQATLGGTWVAFPQGASAWCILGRTGGSNVKMGLTQGEDTMIIDLPAWVRTA